MTFLMIFAKFKNFESVVLTKGPSKYYVIKDFRFFGVDPPPPRHRNHTFPLWKTLGKYVRNQKSQKIFDPPPPDDYVIFGRSLRGGGYLLERLFSTFFSKNAI